MENKLFGHGENFLEQLDTDKELEPTFWKVICILTISAFEGRGVTDRANK